MTDEATTTPPSLTDWMVERVRRAILFGEVQSGERLIISDWSARFGVSQTPMREAIQRLAAEGFLDYDAQRGARVAALSLRDAREIYQIRIQLEPSAVESSVDARTDRWLAELTGAYTMIDDLYEAADGLQAGAVEAHRAFHRVMRAGCESAWLLRITDMLADQSTRMQYASFNARGGKRAAREEHRRLFEAAAAGDAKGAAELSAAHLQRTLDVLQLAPDPATAAAPVVPSRKRSLA